MHPILTATFGFLLHRIKATSGTLEQLSKFQNQLALTVAVIPQATQDRIKMLWNRTPYLATRPVKQFQILRQRNRKKTLLARTTTTATSISAVRLVGSTGAIQPATTLPTA